MCKQSVFLISVIFVLALSAGAEANIQGHWKLDEGSGTVANDGSGNGRHGSVEGAPVWTSPGWDGSGWCLKFGGDNDRITVESFELTGTGITLAAWIRPASYKGDARIISKTEGGGTSEHFWALLLGTSGNTSEDRLQLRLRTDVGGGATGIFAPAGTEIPLNEWTHVAVTWDAGDPFARFFANGQEIYSESKAGTAVATGPGKKIGIGNQSVSAGAGSTIRPFDGLIDDVLIADRAVSEAQLGDLVNGILPVWVKAEGPSPADGAVSAATWATLTWSPGQSAVSHDVYLGDNFDDVNDDDSTGATFRGNQGETLVLVGFFGAPYPDGLVPGTTYYWRIDEVEADGVTKHKGDVWSFRIPPAEAYEPSPPDSSTYVDTGVTLSWDAGLNVVLHTIYFGDNFDDVNNATAGTPLATTNHTPGTLEAGKEYFWRVDESSPPAPPVRGDVWSFTTKPIIPITDPNLLGWWKLDDVGRSAVIDYSGYGRDGSLHGDTHFVPGYSGQAVAFDGSGDYFTIDGYKGLMSTSAVTVTAWVNTTGSGDLMYWGRNSGGRRVDFRIDNGRLRVEHGGGNLLTNASLNDGEWHHVAVTIGAGVTISYPDVKLYLDGQDDTEHRTDPDPPFRLADHADNVDVTVGRRVPQDDRHFIGLIDDVRMYDKLLTQAEIEQVMQRPDLLAAWGPSPANASTPDIKQAIPLGWSAGDDATRHDVYFGADRDAVMNADASDTTGVYRGSQNDLSYNPTEVEFGGGSYYWRIDEIDADGTITTGGVWNFSVTDYLLAEDFESYNDIEAGQPGSNLVYLTWADGFDNPSANGSTMGYAVPFEPTMETDESRGSTGQSAPMAYNNATAPVSEVTHTFPAQNWTDHGVQTLSLWFFGDVNNVPGQLYVKVNGVKVLYDGAASNLRTPAWQPWNIELASIGVNLQSVTSLAIGIEGAFATGTLLLDDIRLYAQARELITPVQPDATGLVGSWAFDGNYNDGSGNGHNGTPVGVVSFTFDPVRGQVLSLPGGDDQFVEIGSVGISGNMPRTIACWAKADNTDIPNWTLIFGFTGQADGSGGAGSHFNVGSLGGPGGVGAHVWSWEETIFSDEAALGWRHYAMTYDGTTIRYYGDGIPMDTDIAKSNVRDLSISADRVHVGSRITNTTSFPGQVDDALIYNRVLSDAEIAGLAGRTEPFDKGF